MDNHRGRPEVVDAMQSGTGSAQRYSTTVGYDMLYRAFYQRGDKQERIVRIATPLKEFDGVIRGMRRSLIAGSGARFRGRAPARLVVFQVFEQAHATLGRIFRQGRRRSFPAGFFSRP